MNRGRRMELHTILLRSIYNLGALPGTAWPGNGTVPPLDESGVAYSGDGTVHIGEFPAGPGLYFEMRGKIMRDANRIPPILDALRLLWIENSDLRLGQLLINLAKTSDLFYLEDNT